MAVARLLCALVALAAVEIHDPLAETAPESVALFTTDDGLPFSGHQLDRALNIILADSLPPETCKLLLLETCKILLLETCKILLLDSVSSLF